jgi:hypothetical protein
MRILFELRKTGQVLIPPCLLSEVRFAIANYSRRQIFFNNIYPGMNTFASNAILVKASWY